MGGEAVFGQIKKNIVRLVKILLLIILLNYFRQGGNGSVGIWFSFHLSIISFDMSVALCIVFLYTFVPLFLSFVSLSLPFCFMISLFSFHHLCPFISFCLSFRFFMPIFLSISLIMFDFFCLLT